MNKKKKNKIVKSKKWKDMFFEAKKEAREREAGYAQLAQVHSAYITILLRKLGATEDNMVTITGAEVKEALKQYEVRAVAAEGGFSLYVEG